MRAPHVQIVTVQGFVERVCTGCWPHVRPNSGGGLDYPDRCPDAAPETRPFPPAGWRMLP